MANNTIKFFCANEQAETEHTIDIDGSRDIVLTCPCGRFIKLPAGTDAAGLKAYAETHRAANVGQVSVEKIEAEKAALLEGLQQGV